MRQRRPATATRPEAHESVGMTLPDVLREQVRRRAGYACEYCGVTETDVGGQLTVDHFQPKAHGGADDLLSLLYCCHRCNLYKADNWPAQPGNLALWNPRREPAETHILVLTDGTLHPLTATGAFTLQRLRLNRLAPDGESPSQARRGRTAAPLGAAPGDCNLTGASLSTTGGVAGRTTRPAGRTANDTAGAAEKRRVRPPIECGVSAPGTSRCSCFSRVTAIRD